MACVSNALMVGGGISGLSAAIALSRAGVTCDVIERDDAHLGATLGVSFRAANALDELGIYEECCKTERVWTNGNPSGSYDAAGNLISKGPKQKSAKRDVPSDTKTPIAVFRPTMLRNMEQAAQQLGVNLMKRTTASTIDDREDGCYVTFSNGEERRYDLLVASDGINSQTRQQFFPEAPKAAYAGQISLRWLAPGPQVDPEGWYIGPVGKVGIFYMPQGQVMVAGVISQPDWKRMTDEEVFALYARLLDSYTAPAMVELRRRLTPDTSIICRPFHWIFVPPPWHRGRVLLIGDAAHATTAHMGMGGGMALEDSVVLGQCVAAASTLQEAFETFMARRLPRVRTVVETSLALSRLEQSHAPTSETVALLDAGFAAVSQPY